MKENNSLKPVAVVGGHVGRDHGCWDALPVRRWGSSRNAGNGHLRGLLQSIQARTLSGVVLWVRWLGHSDFSAIRRACRAAGLPIRIVTGGFSCARAAVLGLLDGQRDDQEGTDG